MARSLATLLEASARRWPHRIAVVSPEGKAFTYAELNRSADALARHLRAGGVERGDRVALLVPKGIPALVGMFGSLKAGAAYVPLDCSGPASRARTVVEDCQVAAAVVHERYRDMLPGLTEWKTGPEAVTTRGRS